MTKIKFCGLRRTEDIEIANRLMPEYIGFVFWEKSRRYVDRETAARLKGALLPDIRAVGVFLDAPADLPFMLLKEGVIDLAQLHGNEGEDYIRRLKQETGKPVIRAMRVAGPEDVRRAQDSIADYLLFDAGAGDGRTFDWAFLKEAGRPYFLAGGLDSGNAGEAVRLLHPYAVDVSSGIETDGWKDEAKMAAFARAVREVSPDIYTG